MNELDKEMAFFIYLLENCAAHRKSSADKILKEWDEAGISDLVYNMYERYHSEDLQNAFADIESLLAEKKQLSSGFPTQEAGI
ncbi:MAG: DUF3791 domain-containing protein [Lentisphaeria bacterium]|nr:DUF3791 domain-containing protein [Lentisphaeria bacterium]